MRENEVFEKYSPNGEYKYIIYKSDVGTYEVWVQRKMTDEYMGPDWFDYCDIQDMRHLTDTLDRAVEIGDEYLRSMI